MRRLLLGLQLAAVGVLIVTSVLGGLRIVERLAAPQPRRPAVTDRVTPARLPPETADFVVWVKAQIPLPAEFSIVDANGKCPGSAKNFWLIYMLLPRTLSCDVDTQYRIYFQSHPPTDNQLPAGTRIFTFRREMHLMELPADRAG